MPLKKTFKGSNYFMAERVTVITRITTEDGIVGEIYNGDELDDLKKIVEMIEKNMAPMILNENIFEVKKIWNKLFPLSFDILSDRKIALNALSCIDSSIHDVIGKTLKLPLYKLWDGGHLYILH